MFGLILVSQALSQGYWSFIPRVQYTISS